MTELSRDARSVIARVRADAKEAPSAEDRARIRAKLDPIWAEFRAQQVGAAAAEPEVALRVARRRTPFISTALWWSLALWTPALPSAAPRPSAERDEAQDRSAAALQPMAAAIEQVPHATVAQPPVVAQSSEPPLSTRRKSGIPLGSPSAKNRSSVARAATLRAAGPLASAERKADGSAAPLLAAATPVEPAAAVGGKDAASLSVARRAANTARAGLHSLASASASPHNEEAALTDSVPTQRNSDFVAQPLDDELEWIGAAQEALRQGQPSRVLRLVQQHAFRFPQGALSPERLALHALALCALHRQATARSVLTDLEHRAPSSPLLERVRRDCGL